MLLVLVVLVGLILVPVAKADGPPPDTACKDCHLNNSSQFTLPSGESLPVGVNSDQLAHSVHGAANPPVYCTDCHTAAEYQFPHPPNPAQNRAEFAANVAQNCQKCHASLQKHNPGHVLARDNPNVPTCANCHGGHDIASASTLAAQPVAFCQSCHQTYTDPKIGAVHQELAANLSAGQTCQTCHPDTPIYPPDVKCKTCHGLLQSKMTLTSGDTVSLHVDSAVIDKSVHGQLQAEKFNYAPLQCTDCHRDQARYGFPHRPATPPDARRFTIEMSDLCQNCHQDEFDKQQDSTHAAALAQGKIEAATCADCHGGHDIQVPNEPRARISQTCSKCHASINKEYAASVHGADLLGENNPDVPVCIDCHGVHNIANPTTALFRVRSPELCAGCHANQELMSKYNISTKVFNTYVADFHGTTVELFQKQSPDQQTNKAVCYDCHGVHNIMAVNDQNSSVMKQNLLQTCRQCHPNATANFSDAWMSHFEPSLQHNALIYLVNLFYAILIPLVVGGFVVFILTDIYRRVRQWRSQKEASHE